MTISRFKDLRAVLAALFLGSCGAEPTANTGNGVIRSTHTTEIAGIVQRSSAAAIERDLEALLRRIMAAGGSPGTELVDAGFLPAPELPQIYSWEGNGRTGRIGVSVNIDGASVEVRVQEGGWT